MELSRAARSGSFYILQLVPDLRPERVRFGWTQDLARRMRPHHYSAPTCALLRAWSCPCELEYPAIRGLTTQQDRRLTREAYDVVNLPALLARADAFFGERELAPVPLPLKARHLFGRTTAPAERGPVELGAGIVCDDQPTDRSDATPDVATEVVLAQMLSLARARVRRGLTLEALALRTGLTVNTLWRIERRRQRPRPTTRLAIATALGYDVADIEELANGGDDERNAQD